MGSSYYNDFYYDDSYSNAVEDVFSSGDMAAMSLAGTFLVVYLIIIAALLLLLVAMYILQAIPLYKLAKKTGRKNAWFAWMPILSTYFQLYLLCDIAGDKPFKLFGDKINISNRRNSFWILLAVTYGFSVVVGILTFVLMLIFPPLALIMYLIALLPAVVSVFVQYVYLRDVIDLFKEDKHQNNTTAIVITLVDTFVTSGFAKIIYLYTLLKYDPLPEIVEETAEIEV